MGRVLHLADVPEVAISDGRWQALNKPLGIRNFGISAKACSPDEKLFSAASSPVSTQEGERILCFCTASTTQRSAPSAEGVALHELPLREMQAIEPKITREALAVLSVESSVKSRTSFGGTAPKNVAAQARSWLKRLEKERK